MVKKLLAAIVLGLATLAHTADIIPPKQTIIQIGGGGSDPTKVPLAGGTMTGSLIMGTGDSSVVLSTSGVITSTGTLTIGASTNLTIEPGNDLTLVSTGTLLIRSTNGTADMPIRLMGRSNGIGYFVLPIINNEGGGVAILLSTSTTFDPNYAPALVLNNPSTNPDLSLGIASGYGTLELMDGEAALRVQGSTPEVYVNTSSVTISGGGGTIHFTSGSGNMSGLSNLTLPSVVNTGQALCKNASGHLSACTSVVGAGGTCTCP